MLIKLEVTVIRPVSDPIPVAIMQEKGGNRNVVLNLSLEQLREIVVALAKIDETPTRVHVAWKEMMLSSGVTLKDLTIHSMDADVGVKCALTFQQNDRVWSSDCRLPDALALALRCNAPIFCEESVLATISAGTIVRIIEDPGDIEEKLQLFTATHNEIPKA